MKKWILLIFANIGEVLALRFPDSDLFPFAPPFESFAMGGEVEVDVLALNRATNILDAPPSVTGDVHNCAERIVCCVGSNRSPVGHSSNRCDADGFWVAFGRAIGNYRLALPVTFPPAALAAFTIAGGLHVDDFRFLVVRNPVFISRCTPT